MKLTKIFIVFTFLLAFAVCVSAQSVQYPNELNGYKFYGKGKLKTLKLTISKLEDLESIFGKECSAICDLDENWQVSFSYVDDMSLKTITKNDIEQNLYVKLQLPNTLGVIELIPKKRISFKNFRFPKVFDKSVGFVGFPSEWKLRFDVYKDSNGLGYWIRAENTKDYRKGDLYKIIYEVPN